MTTEPGTLFIIATPIGNLEDISLRALRILGEIEVLACEDTRYTRRIFERHGIASPKTVFSYHEHNEERSAKGIINLLGKGVSVGLCTKAGYPGISDPGYRIISLTREHGYPVDIIPGAGAVSVALLASGLSTSSYTFKGFPPRKKGQRTRFLEMERESPHTLIFFESPLRVSGFLDEACETYGNRMAAVCIELTKMFQEVHRGYLEDLALKLADVRIKGEVTVVISGNNPKFIK